MSRTARSRSNVALDLIRPINPDVLFNLATQYVSNGNTVNGINPSDLNQGRTNDEKLAIHQPVLLQLATELGMSAAISGHENRRNQKPAMWDDSLPEWQSGFGINQNITSHGIKDICKNVDNPGKHLVQIGNSKFVIGNSGTSAINILQSSDGQTNYAINLQVLKALCFKNEDVQNLVYRINNSVDRLTVTGTANQPVVVMLPNQYATAGYLTRNGNQLTYAEIQNAVETNNASDIEFVALANPIVGRKISKTDFLNAVKNLMQNVKRDDGSTMWDNWLADSDESAVLAKIWNNVSVVQTRSNPESLHCFGWRCAVADTVIARGYGNTRDEQYITMLIGVRSGDSYTEADRSVIESAEQKIRDEKKAAANAEKAAKAQQRAKDKLERQAAQKAKAEAAEAAKAATQVVTATVVDETVNNAPVVTETPVASVN